MAGAALIDQIHILQSNERRFRYRSRAAGKAELLRRDDRSIMGPHHRHKAIGGNKLRAQIGRGKAES